MTKYTHAVVYRIINEKGKEADELTYVADVNQAMAFAHQALAAGKVGVAIIELKNHLTPEQINETSNTS
jgi:hypothetical protein